MTTTPVHAFVHLRSEGVSVLLDCTRGRLPALAHWGADLGEVSAADALRLVEGGVHPIPQNIADEPVRVALLPESWTGWAGRPGLSGSRAGGTGHRGSPPRPSPWPAGRSSRRAATRPS